jgi:hypothetical protein
LGFLPLAAQKVLSRTPFCGFAREPSEKKAFFVRLYCTEKALWKLSWFLRDFGYDAELLSHDQVDVKALIGMQGVVQTSHAYINGRTYQNPDAFAPASELTIGGSRGTQFR